MTYTQRKNAKQFFVPLMSPTRNSFEFSIDPFEPRCRRSLKSPAYPFFQTKLILKFSVLFSYSDRAGDESCGLCCNILTREHIHRPVSRHRIRIENETMSVFALFSNGSSSIQRVDKACPIRLRHWEKPESENRTY